MPRILLNFHLIFRSKIQMSDSRKLMSYGWEGKAWQSESNRVGFELHL